MRRSTIETSVRPAVRLARLTGALLLVMAVTAMFADLRGRSTLVVPTDAEATVARVLAAEGLFRLGLVGYLVAVVCDVPVAIFSSRGSGPAPRPRFEPDPLDVSPGARLLPDRSRGTVTVGRGRWPWPIDRWVL
ncbi:MAG: DUF4386 domain-containing protein [Myxococcota bacterium]